MSLSSDATLTYTLPPADAALDLKPTSIPPPPANILANWIEDPRVVHIEHGPRVGGTTQSRQCRFPDWKADFQLSLLDDKEIEALAEYYPERVERIKEIAGRPAPSFSTTVSLPWCVTRRRRPAQAADTPETPASRARRPNNGVVHRPRARHLAASDAPALLQRRFQIINLWRPIPHAALDWPLAFCDFRSVDKESGLAIAALIYPDREAETYCAKFNEKYEWKDMRGMEPED